LVPILRDECDDESFARDDEWRVIDQAGQIDGDQREDARFTAPAPHDQLGIARRLRRGGRAARVVVIEGKLSLRHGDRLHGRQEGPRGPPRWGGEHPSEQVRRVERLEDVHLPAARLAAWLAR
jgi:hypothetical protein